MRMTASTTGWAPLRLARKLDWSGPLVVRIVLGIAFIGTGWGKLHHLDNLTRYFESLDIPAASVQAPFVAGLELVGGILLLLGLATRLAAGLLACVMAVAIYTAIWPSAAAWSDAFTGVEAIYLATFLYLTVHGAGAISIDHLAARNIETLRKLTPGE